MISQPCPAQRGVQCLAWERLFSAFEALEQTRGKTATPFLNILLKNKHLSRVEFFKIKHWAQDSNFSSHSQSITWTDPTFPVCLLSPENTHRLLLTGVNRLTHWWHQQATSHWQDVHPIKGQGGCPMPAFPLLPAACPSSVECQACCQKMEWENHTCS